MNKPRMRFLATSVVSLTVVLAGASAGCFVEPAPAQPSAAPPPASAPPAAVAPETSEPLASDGWSPYYYDGYVVYFDNYGRPFYYVNGVVFWVPASYVYYNTWVSYWRQHRAVYHRWYQHRGHRYRTYRSRSHRTRAAHRRTRRAPAATRRGGRQPARTTRSGRPQRHR